MFLLQKQDNRIDSSALPSPSEFEDYFKNSDNKNIYYTQVGSHPPHSTSKFIVKETENSSIRWDEEGVWEERSMDSGETVEGR